MFNRLRAAAIFGDADEVGVLLAKGALVDEADEDGLMPLLPAAWGGTRM